MLNSPQNPELKNLLDRLSSLENALSTANSKIASLEDRDYIIDQGTNYIRWAKGKQICMSAVTVGGNSRYTGLFPKGFIAKPEGLAINWEEDSINDTDNISCYSYNGTNFNIVNGHASALVISYIAIGRWK